MPRIRAAAGRLLLAFDEALKTHSQSNLEKCLLEFPVISETRADEQRTFPHIDDESASNATNVRAL